MRGEEGKTAAAGLGRALLYGGLASLFFAFTFIFNRSMDMAGGDWMWSACLRYFIMLPILAVLLGRRMGPVLEAVRARPWAWLLWSSVGFGLFYLPLTLAGVFGASWMVAACWQVTIICGVLLSPLFGERIPGRSLMTGLVILAGIALLQLPTLTAGGLGDSLLAFIPLLVAAFSYPLGNRKMMRVCPPGLNTVQRVFGMTLCSMPFWLVTAAAAWLRVGPPGAGQLVQSGVVALFSGVIATVLFFHATDMVRGEPKKLALVEATQCGEVIFTLIGGVLFLGDSPPTPVGWLGVGLIVLGMVLGSLVTKGE